MEQKKTKDDVITLEDITRAKKELEANDPNRCKKCNTIKQIAVLGLPGIYCKCGMEELLKDPKIKEYVEHSAKAMRDVLM